MRRCLPNDDDDDDYIRVSASISEYEHETRNSWVFVKFLRFSFTLSLNPARTCGAIVSRESRLFLDIYPFLLVAKKLRFLYFVRFCFNSPDVSACNRCVPLYVYLQKKKEKRKMLQIAQEKEIINPRHCCYRYVTTMCGTISSDCCETIVGAFDGICRFFCFISRTRKFVKLLKQQMGKRV